ncbi:MAG: hypothetical protein DHS20C14_09470 [Phycisphaeraceae bacterium]|nr:MAG: hypothetical protein DHS20C14_09470 [Phycisphaeraceae bacterium]
MVEHPATITDPGQAAAAAPLLAQAWFLILLLVILGVASVTVLGVLFSLRRHRAAAPRRKRQVTSKLSAWDEAAARVEPWEGPDPADLDDPDEDT